MKEKPTDDLRAELMEECSIQSYLKENQDSFRDGNVAALLMELYDTRSINKAALARKAGMSEVYLHQVLSGRRRPSRDRLLCLCAVLEAALDETQALLRQAGFAHLDPKNKRDAIIIHGIIHHTGLEAVNDKLFEENEKTLF